MTGRNNADCALRFAATEFIVATLGREMQKLILEVRMNEGARKEANPNVPYRPEEIVADALACAAAGASIVHFHARNADGSESNAVEDYCAIISGIRARSDVLVHPTLGLFQGASAEQRLAHVRHLCEVAGLKPDIAPLDMGSNNIDLWDAEKAEFRNAGYVYANPTGDLRHMASRMTGWGIRPQLAIWSLANLRLSRAFIDAGLLAEPIYAALFLAGEGFLGGHPATLAGLRAYVENLPDRRIEWSVLCHGADLLDLVPEIVRLGGHLSIGLGDNAYPALGYPANADIVRRVGEIARSLGREIASPAEARTMLGL